MVPATVRREVECSTVDLFETIFEHLAFTHAMKTPALALQIRLDVKVPCCLALPMRHDASQLLKAQTQLGRAASEVNRL